SPSPKPEIGNPGGLSSNQPAVSRQKAPAFQRMKGATVTASGSASPASESTVALRSSEPRLQRSQRAMAMKRTKGKANTLNAAATPSAHDAQVHRPRDARSTASRIGVNQRMSLRPSSQAKNGLRNRMTATV